MALTGPLPLADGFSISGALTATLTVAHAQTGDAGNYSVVVSNVKARSPARMPSLVVNYAPVILDLSRPARRCWPGSVVTFMAGVYGFSPMSYQRQHAGVTCSTCLRSAVGDGQFERVER